MTELERERVKIERYRVEKEKQDKAKSLEADRQWADDIKKGWRRKRTRRIKR